MELHLEDFCRPCGNYKPHLHGIALGRFFCPWAELQAPPGWNCTWKIFRTWARIKNPAGVELHLEDFSPLRENQIPRRGGIALGRFFALGRGLQNPPRWELDLEDFSPLGKNYKLHPDGIALSRNFCPNPAGVELHLEDFSPLDENRKRHRGGIALGRFFRPCARITNPTPDGIALWKISRSQTPPGRNCSLEDLSLTNPTRKELHFGRSLAHKPHPDGIALWKIFRPWVRVTNPARVELRFGRFFTLAKITNPTRVELDLEDFSPLQTPPGWNCTLEDFSPLGENYKPRRGGIALWRIFRPNLNPAGVELHLEDF